MKRNSPKRITVLLASGAGLFLLANTGLAQMPGPPGFVDNFADGMVISGYTNFVTGDNTSYTKEPGEPQHAARKGAHSAWVRWIAPDTGVCVMDTLGSSFDTVLAVYTGNSVSSLSSVAANDDTETTVQSRVSFTVTTGVVYQIAIDGYSTNDAGSIMFRLSFVGPPPTIDVPPQSLSVLAGSNAIFNVTARGGLPLAYQWLFGGLGGTPLPHGTNAILTIINAQSADAGFYRVVASNAAGAVTSAVATLTVRFPPLITSQPQSQLVVTGATVTFNVSASGTPPLRYQWLRDGTTLTASTNASLLVINAQPADTGNYTVVVTNAYGGATSAVASLNLAVAPGILVQPQDQVVLLGATVIMGVTASGSAPLSFQWRRGALALINQTNSTLVLPNVQPLNEDGYTVVVSNVAGVVTSAVAQVTIGLPPAITQQPVSRTFVLGTTAIFVANATGTPPLSYQWLRNQSDFANRFGRQLLITNVQLAHAGEFTAVVSNAFGSATSAVAILTVQLALITSVDGNGLIIRDPDQSSYAPNQAVTLTAVAGPGLGFAGWSGATNTTQNPLTLVMDSNKTMVARFTSYALTVASSGGGAVTYDPVRPTYLPNSTVTLTATPNPGWGFIEWSGSTNSNMNPLQVLMNGDKTILARFTNYVLSVSVSGRGTVTRVPQQAIYLPDTMVTLTAVPDRWYVFTRWADGLTNNPRIITIGPTNFYGAIFSPTAPLETLTFGNVTRIAPIGMPAVFVDGVFVPTGRVTRLVSADVTLRTSFTNGAVFYTLDGSAPSLAAWLYDGPFHVQRSATIRAVAFRADFGESWEADPVELVIEPVFTIDASTAGGGTVGVSPAAAFFPSNTMATLTAAAAPGWRFLQWAGDVSGTAAVASVRVQRSVCARAVFGTALGTTAAGSGAVAVDPAITSYPYGTVVRLTAVPQSGHYFAAWGNAVMSTNSPLLFPVTSANPTVSCAFVPLSAGQAALTVRQNGRGRVTLTPRGSRFPVNQIVTLTATADADQEFLGWTGDAAGNATNLTVTLSQSKVITANFTRRPRFILGPCEGGWREEGFQLTLAGEFGVRYRIERSSGLTGWEFATRLTNTFGFGQFTDRATVEDGSRFYRAIEEP